MQSADALSQAGSQGHGGSGQEIIRWQGSLRNGGKACSHESYRLLEEHAAV
jgi:hypothetical protein